MNEREQRKNELLMELSRRFRDNADAMRKVAERIQTAAQKSKQLDKHLQHTGERLQECLETSSGVLPFSYLEYLEFANADEFNKFRQMPVVNDEDLMNLDVDKLCQQLLD